MSAIVKTKPLLRDRIIPWYFVMGFLVVLAVNSFFVYTAVRSNPGVVTEHAYEQGLAYNSVLAETRTEQALGWKGSIRYDQGMLHFTVHDQPGRFLSGATVKAYIDRPLKAGLSQTVALKETSNESYSAPVSFTDPGQWDVTVSVIWNKHYHQTRQRIIVP